MYVFPRGINTNTFHPRHSLCISIFLGFSRGLLPSISHALTQYFGGLRADGGGRDVDKWERGVSDDPWGLGEGGGAELKVTQCCLEVFTLAGVFSLYLSLSLRGGHSWGVKRRLAPSHQRVESVPSH